MNANQLRFELDPLVLNYLIHDVLLDQSDKILHLLPKELQLAKDGLFLGAQSSVLRQAQLLPDMLQAVLCTFNLQNEEEDSIVLSLTKVTDHAVDGVPRVVPQLHVVTDLKIVQI